MSSPIRADVNTVVTTLLTTELNSITSGSKTVVSSAYDNRTDEFLWADFEGVLATGITPGGSQTWEIFAIPTIDGTNYADGGSSVVPSSGLLLGTLKFQAVTGQQRVIEPRLPIPPHSFKVMVRNNLNATLPAASNTLKMITHAGRVG